MRATCLLVQARPRVCVSRHVPRSTCFSEEEQIRKVSLILGGLLSASLLANVTLVMKLVHVQAREDAIPASAGAATSGEKAAEALPVPEDRAEISELLIELRQVHRELLASRTQTKGRTIIDRGSAIFTQGPIASDPEIASVLADRAASDKFWRDLESLLDARAVIGEARYLDLGLKMTEEYLQLDPSSAREFERMVLAVLESLGQARMTADAADNDDPSREDLRAYQEQVGAVTARLDPYLDSSFRHQQFRLNIERWVGHFLKPVEQ
jgi:hypothetical protein